MTKEGKEMLSSIPLPSFRLTSYAHVLRASSNHFHNSNADLPFCFLLGRTKFIYSLVFFFILVLLFITCLQTL